MRKQLCKIVIMQDQPTVRLNFTCNRNWEDMTIVENGHFCNDCQKKVVDFTDKTPDEIAAYLISSTTKVCGRFQQSQLSPSRPKPVWKRWLSAAAMFVTVFIGVKEASAQTKASGDSTNSINQKDKRNNYALGGEIVIVRNNIIPKNSNTFVQGQEPYSFDAVDVLPTFPSGEKAFAAYLRKNIPSAAHADKTGIASFVVKKDGSITNVSVLKSVNDLTDKEAINALEKSPKWTPGRKNGKAVDVSYTIPFSF